MINSYFNDQKISPDRVMQVLGNNGQVTDQDYDVNDNPVASTDGKNHRTENQYDALNRVNTIIDPKLGETRITIFQN